MKKAEKKRQYKLIIEKDGMCPDIFLNGCDDCVFAPKKGFGCLKDSEKTIQKARRELKKLNK